MKKQTKISKKGSVSNDLIWILILIAGAVMVGLMAFLIVLKHAGLF